MDNNVNDYISKTIRILIFIGLFLTLAVKSGTNKIGIGLTT